MEITVDALFAEICGHDCHVDVEYPQGMIISADMDNVQEVPGNMLIADNVTIAIEWEKSSIVRDNEKEFCIHLANDGRILITLLDIITI